jgi:hypothetical protein
MKRIRNVARSFFLPVVLLSCGSVSRAQSQLDALAPNPNGPVRAIVVQPDSKILVGGSFTAFSQDGVTPIGRNHIARLNVDGSIDLAFNPDADVDVEAIALEADGSILVGGQFTVVGGEKRNHIARLNPVTGLAD